MKILQTHVFKIYNDYVQSVPDTEKYSRIILEGIKQGKVIYSHGMNPLFLICSCLKEYRPDPKENKIFDKLIHLPRDVKTRKIDYNQGKDRRWYEFQIEKGATSMFCPVPTSRRQRLRKQIVLLKTFWGISALQRDQQLHNIIEDCIFPPDNRPS